MSESDPAKSEAVEDAVAPIRHMVSDRNPPPMGDRAPSAKAGGGRLLLTPDMRVNEADDPWHPIGTPGGAEAPPWADADAAPAPQAKAPQTPAGDETTIRIAALLRQLRDNAPAAGDPAADEAHGNVEDPDDDPGLFPFPDRDGMNIPDDEVLRKLVADVVREELQTLLKQRITRSVRNMVRREISLALAAEDHPPPQTP
ncbi:MAG: hypothetical protein GDA52_02940 [Rhodobacteraceae bacterium]|nr:hypothetical protein [Paracoccaceae bacterium]